MKNTYKSASANTLISTPSINGFLLAGVSEVAVTSGVASVSFSFCVLVVGSVVLVSGFIHY